jgi:hypothetical protein
MHATSQIGTTLDSRKSLPVSLFATTTPYVHVDPAIDETNELVDDERLG